MELLQKPKLDTTTVQEDLGKANELLATHPDSAARLYRTTLEQSNQLQYDYGRAMSWVGIGKSSNNETLVDSAFQQAINYSRKVNHRFTAIIFNMIALQHIDHGQYGKAALNLYLAMDEMQRHNITDPVLQIVIYNNLSSLWKEMDIKDSAAAVYAQRINAVIRKSNNPAVQAVYNTYQGRQYFDQKNWDSARYYTEIAWKLINGKSQAAEQEQFVVNQAKMYILSQMGEIVMQLKQPAQAIQWFNQARILAEDYHHIPHQILSAFYIGKAWNDLHKQPETIASLEKAISLADQSGFIATEVLEAHTLLASIYAGNQQYKKALVHQEAAMVIKDSLLNKEKVQVMGRLETQQRVSEKNREIAQKQLVITQQTGKIREKNFWIAGVAACSLLLVLLLIAIYRANKNKQALQAGKIEWFRQEADMQLLKMQSLKHQAEIQVLQASVQGEEKERTRLARELHDGIISQLCAIKMNLDTVSYHTLSAKETNRYIETLNHLDNAIEELRKTAHNMIPEILLKEGLIRAIAIFAQNISAGAALKIGIQSFGDLDYLQPEFELSVYRMIQELLQNTVKHAKATEVLVQINSHDGLLSITVEDNGIGMDPGDMEKRNSMGLRNLKARTEAMSGTIDITGNAPSGTVIYLEFDIIPMIKTTDPCL